MGSGLYKTNIVFNIDSDKSDAIKYYNRLKTKGYDAKVFYAEGTGWKTLATPGFVLNSASRLIVIGHGANTGRVAGPFGEFWDADELIRQMRHVVGKDYFQLATFLTCFSGGIEEEFDYWDAAEGAMQHVNTLAYRDSIGYKFMDRLPGVVETHARGGIVVSTTTATDYVKSSTTSGRGVQRSGSMDKVIFKRENGTVKTFTRGF